MHDETIAKIRQLPDFLVQEVNDFVDFLLIKHRNSSGSETLCRSAASSTQFAESLEIAESDFSSYLSNLEDYEELLARGEIQW